MVTHKSCKHWHEVKEEITVWLLWGLGRFHGER
jgi:hypothetical protein